MSEAVNDVGIPYSRVESALAFLARTDEPVAGLKADVLRSKAKIEAAKAAIILHVDGTGPVKQAEAQIHRTVRDAEEWYFQAVHKHEAMKNERERNDKVIEVWRSVSSAKNHGQIL